jgi:3-oxoacyl-ACP reductase-like protein
MMSIFSSIKNAIFGKPAEAKVAAPAAHAAPATSAAPTAAAPAAPQPAPMEEVDVEQRLDAMPGADNLNWRTSIVDLMKLIGIDSSLSSRKELAMELGYTGDLDGSAEMNIWLHKRTMQELASNGGKVPASLLD